MPSHYFITHFLLPPNEVDVWRLHQGQDGTAGLKAELFASLACHKCDQGETAIEIDPY